LEKAPGLQPAQLVEPAAAKEPAEQFTQDKVVLGE